MKAEKGTVIDAQRLMRPVRQHASIEGAGRLSLRHVYLLHLMRRAKAVALQPTPSVAGIKVCGMKAKTTHSYPIGL
jgi:hypothetical protein